MILLRVRIHKIVWNGNDGEVWYTDVGGAADHLRALLGSFGFRFGTPVARPGGDGALQALPVVACGGDRTAAGPAPPFAAAFTSPPTPPAPKQ